MSSAAQSAAAAEKAGRRDASVLVLALWALFFLASLAVAAGAYVSAALNAAARIEGRQRAREQAVAGVWKAWEIARTATNDAQVSDNPEAFRDNTEMPGGSFTVYHLEIGPEGVVSTNYGAIHEVRRLNLNKAGETGISAMIRDRAGLSQASASQIAAAIVAARSGNAGLTSPFGEDYDGSGSYAVRNRQYQLPEELMLVAEVREAQAVYGAIEPFVTVFGKGFYSGTSVGRSGMGMPEYKVKFVVSVSGSIAYWFEE